MRIPFIDKIKELEKKLNKAEAEIQWQIEWKHKTEKKMELIEKILTQGAEGKLTKKRMSETIKHILSN
tara:strand:- start:381 stop:584 length:204 start_codon:yes stop_codon:yes gene_type:complete